MSLVTSPRALPSPPPAASLADWARVINGLAASSHEGPATAPMNARAPRRTGAQLLACGPRPCGRSATGTTVEQADADYRMAPAVAEQLVADGLDAAYLSHLAQASGLDLRAVLEFAGIDRSTVSRRLAAGAALPQEAAVKALQITDLVTQAAEVFGTPAAASAWLGKPHPLLQGQTPLQRARTPWGMDKVVSMLVALRYGGAV